MNKLLIVDDESQIVDILSYACKREGFAVETAFSGQEALRKIEEWGPAILILDLMLPDMNGFEVCRKIKDPDSLGIIMLTAKNDILDKLVGLELGADDYMTKPFDIRELIARVHSLLRRMRKKSEETESPDRLAYGKLVLSRAKRKVSLDGEALVFTPKEFDLLALLLRHLDRVYTREELLESVWGFDFAGGTRTVDIHLQWLRKKLGPVYQQILVTIHGVGYKATLERIGEEPEPEHEDEHKDGHKDVH
ncbi:response regulator transcription factor [Paenibacillus sp. GbtcB18]|uniref:response regulator transcription factor n=1 Tax=Paenibacillus sp. GbtcB18 TaxID=2824763 RepID=UPI001C2F90B0|nr:response regulator transcription factor [Paenibacillus sp. GbtcB18]